MEGLEERKKDQLRCPTHPIMGYHVASILPSQHNLDEVTLNLRTLLVSKRTLHHQPLFLKLSQSPGLLLLVFWGGL